MSTTIRIDNQILKIALNTNDEGMAASAAATAAALKALGLLTAKTLAPLATFVSPQGRGDKTLLRYVDGSADLLIDSSYNASPDAVVSAISQLGSIPVRRNRVVVLGDMLELGAHSEQFHMDLVSVIDRSATLVFATGSMMRRLFDVLPEKFAENDSIWSPTLDQLIENVTARFRSERGGSAILVKGSNAMGLSAVVAALKKQSFVTTSI